MGGKSTCSARPCRRIQETRKLWSYALPRYRCTPHGGMKQPSHDGCVDSSESTLSFSQSALVCLLYVTLFSHLVLEILKPTPKAQWLIRSEDEPAWKQLLSVTLLDSRWCQGTCLPLRSVSQGDNTESISHTDQTLSVWGIHKRHPWSLQQSSKAEFPYLTLSCMITRKRFIENTDSWTVSHPIELESLR